MGVVALGLFAAVSALVALHYLGAGAGLFSLVAAAAVGYAWLGFIEPRLQGYTAYDPPNIVSYLRSRSKLRRLARADDPILAIAVAAFLYLVYQWRGWEQLLHARRWRPWCL
jgi:hypothetical protein